MPLPAGQDFPKFDGNTTFEPGFLMRLGRGDAAATGLFSIHLLDTVRIWLKVNRPELQGEAEGVAGEVLRRTVLQPELQNTQTLGKTVCGICRQVATEFFVRGPEPSLEGRADRDNGRQSWLSGGRQDCARRVFDELPPKDRNLLSRIFQEDHARAEEICREFEVDAGYVRRLLFRARLRFRDLESREHQKTVSGDAGLQSPEVGPAGS